MTFRQAVNRWRAFKASAWGETHRNDVAGIGEKWCAVLGSKPLGAIEPLDVQDLYQKRGALTRAGYGINVERTLFRGFWLWALRMKLVREEHSRAWPRKKAILRRPHVVLTREEVEALCSTLMPRYARLVRFAVLVGLRMGELRRMVWGWIGADGVLTVPATARKQGIAFSLVLIDRALQVLGPRGEPGKLVFPRIASRSCLNRMLKRAARRAGLSDAVRAGLTGHAFRRGWATGLLEQGVPDSAVLKLGGWASMPVLIRHYHHLRASKAREYMELA